MKNLFKIIGVAALLATITAISANAQGIPSYGLQVISPIAANWASGSTNYTLSTSAPYIDVSRSQVFSIQTTIATGVASGGTNIYTLAPSVDGLHFDTTAADELLYTNGFTAAETNTTCRQFTSGGYQAYEIANVATTIASGAMTNLQAYAGVKISSP